MLVTPSLRHCSNKYKLAREGINKEKDRNSSIESLHHILGLFIIIIIKVQNQMKPMQAQLHLHYKDLFLHSSYKMTFPIQENDSSLIFPGFSMTL